MSSSCHDDRCLVGDLDGRSDFFAQPNRGAAGVLDVQCARTHGDGAAGHLFGGPVKEITGAVDRWGLGCGVADGEREQSEE